ncbi:hypothetical protein LIX60_08650 [Streptomyces sp. S07_1.15]|uniref:hypothetical protein n=1 Tax=Streptomyces sp. S07_1.15 TaxID=2873925 RepID=UPI001D15780D|nr:hypothetical protein [Streptomyces sp. S07_1.15]MCC3651533.1 hypothetical protein [Streptomyces sp. S07_1.15]
MFDYELHRIQQAELLREAAERRLVRQVLSARRSARRAARRSGRPGGDRDAPSPGGGRPAASGTRRPGGSGPAHRA